MSSTHSIASPCSRDGVARPHKITHPRTKLAYFPFDPINPYQRLLYRDLQIGGVDSVPGREFTLRWLATNRRIIQVLHIHWPQTLYRVGRRPRWLMRHLSFIKFASFLARLTAARALGYRVVWTIHQVYPHEIRNPILDRLAPLFLARIAGTVRTRPSYRASCSSSSSPISTRDPYFTTSIIRWYLSKDSNQSRQSVKTRHSTRLSGVSLLRRSTRI
jgi:hypothetical protein